MLKRFLAISLAMIMAFAIGGCGKKSDIPEYAEKQFEISGFWAPYEITEESFKQYKDVGFTTLAMINHSLGRTSEEQFYLGSDRTMKALEMCDKVGLNAILNYNDWIVLRCEEDGEDFYGKTPFSKHDIYGEYKDIITGIHICDEPYLKNWNNENHFETYGNKTLVEDFKKVYPNAKFIVNLIPITAIASRGFDSYDQMMELYEKTFMEPFKTPFVSVDVYPFHQGMVDDDRLLATNYEYIANSAKKFGVKPGFILQSSVGGADEGKKEFEMELSEADLRWEINNALAFGADTLQYYCYSVPSSFDKDGKPVYMYDNCILNRDGTPSDVYYSLQKLHKEIQSFASVILSYDWEKSIGMSGNQETIYRVTDMEFDDNFQLETFDDPKHYVSADSSHDLLISHFTSEEYGEAYMFVNFADRGGTNAIESVFKDCKKLAIYGGTEYSGTPTIVELNEKGEYNFSLGYGEGAFIVPIV